MKKRINKLSIIFLSLWFIAIQFSCSPSYLKTGTYWTQNGERLTLKEDSTYRYFRLSHLGGWVAEGHWKIERKLLILSEGEKEPGVLQVSMEITEEKFDYKIIIINSNLNDFYEGITLKIFFENEYIKDLNVNNHSFKAEYIPKEVVLVVYNEVSYNSPVINHVLTSEKILLDTIAEVPSLVRINVEITHDDFWRVSRGDMIFFIKSKRKFKSPENTFRWMNPRRK